MRMRLDLFLLVAAAGVARGQTTQGLITGRAVDSQTGAPVAAAEVTYFSATTNAGGSTRTASSGYYVFPLLAPGAYRVRITADRYQAQEVQQLDLPVASTLDVNFRLRPLSDVWEAGQYRSVFLPDSDAIVTFYGPDVDTSRFGSFAAARGALGALEASLSRVIDPVAVRELPLAGRDVYTMLVTQPGVTADSATTRGLGLAANGQRPSASNFLLDGLENNNYQVTGPLTAVAPEAVQEYRLSINNFSAEYGRTSGFLANAVTRSGGTAWHGIGYFHLHNEWLNANTFQRNLRGLERAPAKQRQIGFQAGGPVPKTKSWFASSAYEHFRSRGQAEPTEFLFPTTIFAAQFTAPDSLARRLLTQFPAPAVTDRNLPVARLSVAQPVSIDRSLALERIDWRPAGGRHHVMGRLSLARLSRPDFIWTPYPQFVSGLNQNTTGVAINWQSALTPRLTSEARFGWASDDLGWDRARPEIPTLFETFEGTVLPGSPAFYEYRNRTRHFEAVENVVWATGRHIAKFGGGFLIRSIDGFLTAGRDGLYTFNDIIDFSLDTPAFFYASLARQRLPAFRIPDYDRSYRYDQFFLFAQDTFRLAPRLTLNYGLRYERFGSPRNASAEKDAFIELGSGADFGQRLTSSRLVFPPAGDQQLYGSDNNDLGARFGFSYDLTGAARTLVRGAYGLFYDRPFDNLWQNLRSNNFVLGGFQITNFGTNYLEPVSRALERYQGQPFAGDFPDLTLFDRGLRNAYVHSYLFGVERRVTESMAVEATFLGSLGRKLIATDIVNRIGSRPGLGSGNDSRYRPDYFDVSHRSGQGASNYHALSLAARYRGSRSQFHLAYTWSHTIDNQSEPLAGDFFDLRFTRITSGQGRSGEAAFARQFDSRADRGNSDFDQRHNLVFYSVWDLPAARAARGLRVLTRDWRFAQLAAFRTGFPFTVRAPSQTADSALLLNNRADLVDPARVQSSAPAPGGRRLLDVAAFRAPARGVLGNTGRNAFPGPGFLSVDISLARSFPLPWLGESSRITLRADAFNFLNHTNLGDPEPFITSPDFGLARFGRRGRDAGFPALTPFTETGRQVQLLLRLDF